MYRKTMQILCTCVHRFRREDHLSFREASIRFEPSVLRHGNLKGNYFVVGKSVYTTIWHVKTGQANLNFFEFLRHHPEVHCPSLLQPSSQSSEPETAQSRYTHSMLENACRDNTYDLMRFRPQKGTAFLYFPIE